MRIDEKDPRRLLQTFWGYDDFRGIQSDIIHSILHRHDTLGLMPTGGGKSIAFQVPALALEGVCIVVTPLIALMKDQVEHLRRRSITAAAIYSGQTREEMLRHLDNAVFGAYKFLYVSPERLSTEIFQVKVRKMKVSLLTVDEAHCISQWGYDFRPSYLEIATIRRLLPGVPVLALTATATPDVVRDICTHLAPPDTPPAAAPDEEAKGEWVEGFRVFRMSFARPNLAYVVRQTGDKFRELLHILRSVPGSAIVYTRNRQGTREVSDRLNEEGIHALFFHAGLPNADKDVRQRAWQEGATRVMVATNAFGMGIDKPDVRLVIHLDAPDSIEAYFQEAGRAGRDGLPAYAVLLAGREDHANLLRRVSVTFPPREYVSRVYEELCCFFQLAVGDGFRVTYEFDEETFCHAFRHFPTQLESALHLLSRAGYIDYREEDETRSRVLFLVHRDDLYSLHRLGRTAEAVIRALLRTTCGLFSDYSFIEEDEIARHCDMTEHEVYEALKQLTTQRVLHYVPRKKVPRITFLTRRVETREVTLTAEVYENRRTQYTTRVQQMLDYIDNGDYCRSRFLLEYFADYSGHDCGRCDVCLQQKGTTSPAPAALCDHILTVLADGRPHRPTDFDLPGTAPARIAATLQEMVESGSIKMQDGQYMTHPAS